MFEVESEMLGINFENIRDLFDSGKLVKLLKRSNFLVNEVSRVFQ